MCFAGIHASNAFFCQNIHGEQKFIHVWGGKACQAEFRVSWEHCSQRGNSWIIQSHTYHPPPHQQFTLSCAPIRENCGKQKHFRLQTKAIATVWAIMVIRHPPPPFTHDISKLSVSWCRQAGSRPQEPQVPNVPFIYPCLSLFSAIIIVLQVILCHFSFMLIKSLPHDYLRMETSWILRKRDTSLKELCVLVQGLWPRVLRCPNVSFLFGLNVLNILVVSCFYRILHYRFWGVFSCVWVV